MPDCNHSLVRPLLPIIQDAQNEGKINLQKTKKERTYEWVGEDFMTMTKNNTSYHSLEREPVYRDATQIQ